VHLRYRYGESRPFTFQRWLIKAMSPRPAASFYLDVAPATAVARKVDQYDTGQLERQVRLYREECDRWGVVRLDGERPVEDLAAEIATTVWTTSRRPSRSR
jgi:thymidylate kinase